MPETPPGFGPRATALLGGIGHGETELKRSLETAAELVDEVRGVVEGYARWSAPWDEACSSGRHAV